MKINYAVVVVMISTLLFVSWITMPTATTVAFAQAKATPPPYPDLKTAIGLGARGESATDKLGPELRQLYEQYGTGRGASTDGVQARFSDSELKEMFGISGGDDPLVSVAVTVNAGADTAALTAAGMKVYLKIGDTAYGEIPVRSLGSLVEAQTISQVAATKAVRPPVVPKAADRAAFELNDTTRGTGGPESGAASAATANQFNKGTLTGKGVIVGVIDTGIDWRHQDFIKPDGTSRILAIWDPYDNSNSESGGKTGTAPPILAGGRTRLPGTIYTNAQINAALKGSGTVNTTDSVGHGTAVAGTAGGNGRGAKLLASKMVEGVAPDAEFIVFRTFDCEDFSEYFLYGAAWMVQTAKSLGKPIVINQSFGGHASVHDGTESEETALNRLTGKGIPGVVFTVSAGNEGRESLHGSGRFDRSDHVGKYSEEVSVNVASTIAGGVANILWRFDSKDDWGIAVVPKNSDFVDTSGKPLIFFLFRDSTGAPKYQLGKGLTAPDWFDGYAKDVLSRVARIGTSDRVLLPLSPGSYSLFGFGASTRVVDGDFDVYSPQYRDVQFGRGTSKTLMVGTPGNATNVITVGASNFRNSWKNSEGGDTIFNLPIDDIASYSSPGGRRKDGVVKPDITSPASYTLSPLSHDALAGSSACGADSMGSAGGKFVTLDKNYIAWEGTSASSPFTAGVVALMLQKNPGLDAEQIRQILIKTARKGGAIGAVPNPQWGWGLIDPAAAIAATPMPGAVKKTARVH